MADGPISYDELGATLYKRFTGRAISGETRNVPSLIRAVEAAIGGPGAAARAAGVHPSTWRRWRAGTQRPGPRTRDALHRASRAALMPPSKQARFNSKAPVLKVRAQVSSDERSRKLDAVSLNWTGYGMTDVVQAFLHGGDAREIGQAFADQIGDGFYRGFIEGSATTVLEAHFEGLNWERD